jgi:hypothetical protein
MLAVSIPRETPVILNPDRFAAMMRIDKRGVPLEMRTRRVRAHWKPGYRRNLMCESCLHGNHLACGGCICLKKFHAE